MTWKPSEWGFEAAVEFSGTWRLLWWKESAPLKNNVLFICCQGNKSECGYLCVYGLCSICPFGKAPSPPSLKGFTFLTKSKFDGLGLCWIMCASLLRSNAGEPDLCFSEMCAFFFFFTCLTVGASTERTSLFKIWWHTARLVLQRKKVNRAKNSKKNMTKKRKDMKRREIWCTPMLFRGNIWRIWSSFIFEVMLVVWVFCCRPKWGNIFCLDGCGSLCHLRHQWY